MEEDIEAYELCSTIHGVYAASQKRWFVDSQETGLDGTNKLLNKLCEPIFTVCYRANTLTDIE